MFKPARICRGFFVLGLLAVVVEAGSACSASAPVAEGADAGPTVDGGGPAVDGGSSDGGNDGSVGTGTPLGLVLVTQTVTTSTAHASILAQFFASAPPLPAGCTITPVAGCVATSCPEVQPSPPRSSLNAGAITVTGAGPNSPATLTFGALAAPAGINGYTPVSEQTRFYSSGDMLSVTGAGGPDLPSFAAQTVVAPNDIVVTAPACTSQAGECTDVDRSTDETLTWTGGSIGKVTVSYITNTDDGTKTLSCVFDAAGGTGVVPSAALKMLNPASAPGYHGQVYINPFNSKPFVLGTLAAELKVQGTLMTGTFTTVN